MKKRKTYIRYRHKVVFFILRPLFRWFLFFRYRFNPVKYPEKIKEPHLILSNHAINFDPFFLTASFRTPIYFVANEHIYATKCITQIIRYLISAIPKSKSRSDFGTTKQILSIVKEGGTIGIFPEGNSTNTGENTHISSAIAKLVKKLKIPVLFYHIHGNYLSNPRWGDKVRKGKVTGEVVRKWTYEEYQHMSEESIQQFIEGHVYVNAYEQQHKNPIRYVSKAPAHYIERVLFVCPRCRAIDKITSEGRHIHCRNCNLDIKIDDFGFFDDTIEGIHTVIDWDNWQKPVATRTFDAYPDDTVLYDPSRELVIEIKRDHKNLYKISHGHALLSMTKLGIKLTFEKHDWFFPIQEIDEITMQDKNHILLYTNTNQTFLLRGEKKRSAYKYIVAFQHLKAKANGNKASYLGL